MAEGLDVHEVGGAWDESLPQVPRPGLPRPHPPPWRSPGSDGRWESRRPRSEEARLDPDFRLSSQTLEDRPRRTTSRPAATRGTRPAAERTHGRTVRPCRAGSGPTDRRETVPAGLQGRGERTASPKGRGPVTGSLQPRGWSDRAVGRPPRWRMRPQLVSVPLTRLHGQTELKTEK